MVGDMFIEARQRPGGTDLTPAALLLMSRYVHCANVPRHASTHGFLQKMVTWHMREPQKWLPGRGRGPSYSIVCSCYKKATYGNYGTYYQYARGESARNGHKEPDA